MPAEYAPLIAITAMVGNRRRTTDRSSKPDMRGHVQIGDKNIGHSIPDHCQGFETIEGRSDDVAALLEYLREHHKESRIIIDKKNIVQFT